MNDLSNQPQNLTRSPINDEKNKYYHVDVKSDYAPTLKLILRSHKSSFIPYGIHPFIRYSPDTGIQISTEECDVFITGRNLDRIADWLGRYKVTWIKESLTGFEFETNDVFVENIIIKDKY